MTTHLEYQETQARLPICSLKADQQQKAETSFIDQIEMEDSNINNKEFVMKKSLRDPLTDKALNRKPLPTLPLSPSIMRQSMVAKSTAAARAAGLRHLNVQLEKSLTDRPNSPTQSRPQSAPRGVPKSGSRRGKLANGTMRKPIPYTSDAQIALDQNPGPHSAETRDQVNSTAARRPKDPSYPPSAWTRFADRRQNGTFYSRAPRTAVWRPGPDLQPSMPPSDYPVNQAKSPETGQLVRRFGNHKSVEIATKEKQHLQPVAEPVLSRLKRPRTAGERIVNKLSTWSRGLRDKSATQDRPNSADTAPAARRRDSAHWGPFRTAIEKMTATSRPSSQEERRLPISRPIDHGDVFTADVVARQQAKPREYSSWLAAHLAETGVEPAPLDPDDLFASMSRDTKASMESRMTQMQDFMDRESRLEQPIPRSSLVSKLIHPRTSLSHPETRHNNESSPLDFACVGEWVDPEPDYDPFKQFDEVLTLPESSAREEMLVPEMGLGITGLHSDLFVASNSPSPDCRTSERIYNNQRTNHNLTAVGARPPSSSCSPKHTGQVQSNTAQVVPNRVSVYSQYPQMSWKSLSPDSQPTPSASHSSPRKEAYRVDVDLSSLAGAAYHEDSKFIRPGSPAASSEYSMRRESMVYEDPGNPFADQHAIDAYREAMNRWHPPTSQVAPLALGTSSFAQHRERVLQQRQQANMIASPDHNGKSYPMSDRHASRTERGSLYTLADLTDDEVSAASPHWIHGRETWMTLDPRYLSGSRSYGTLSDANASYETGDTTVSYDHMLDHEERSFASRIGTKTNFSDPVPCSQNEERWPYAPSESDGYHAQQLLRSRSRTSQESLQGKEVGLPGLSHGLTSVAEGKSELRRKQVKQALSADIRDTAFYGVYDDVLSDSPVDGSSSRRTMKSSSRLSRPWEPDVPQLR